MLALIRRVGYTHHLSVDLAGILVEFYAGASVEFCGGTTLDIYRHRARAGRRAGVE